MKIDFSKVTKLSDYVAVHSEEREVVLYLHDSARDYLLSHEWCARILESYVGMLYPGVVGVFLFRIEAAAEGVDPWLWVVVGDLPPAFLSPEFCSNPAGALDGYIGEMRAWAEAVEQGRSVDDLIPVNAPPSLANAQDLKGRLMFLDEKVLSGYEGDLRAAGRT